MPIWCVKAESCDYDEYDAFVVRAGTAEGALALVKGRFLKEQGALTATLYPAMGEDEVILGSYNAG